jgi:streptogramin lyase
MAGRTGKGWFGIGKPTALLFGTLVLWLLLALVPAAASASITEFMAGMNAGAQPGDIVQGPGGNLWFTDGKGAIGKVTPSGAITEFSSGLHAESDPQQIISGPDGNLWFTDDPFETGTPAIGRISTSGTITEFNSGLNQDAEPIDVAEPTSIVTGPDGNVWYTDSTFFYEGRNSAIGRITPSGTLTEFEMPEAVSTPLKLIVGPDGNLWFTDPSRGPFNSAIGRITPSGTTTEFSTVGTTGAPRDLVIGPDGNIWFTARNGIGRITPSGTITAFSSGLSAEPNLGKIINGPDGNLWFTDSGNVFATEKAIGRITPSGTITEFPTTDPERRPPTDLISGPDGNLWFTYDENGQVSRITPSGQVTNFSLGLSPDAEPRSIVAGPGGSDLWFTDAPFEGAPAIARISPVGPGVSPNPTLTIVPEGSGSVSSQPGGINCGSTCSAEFPSGTPITLSATAAAGSTFMGWNAGRYCAELECNFAELEESGCGGTAACTFSLGGDTTVPATFAPGSGGGGGSPAPAPTPAPPPPSPKPRHRKPLHCRKGFKKRKVHGRVKCVRIKRNQNGAAKRFGGARLSADANGLVRDAL